MNRRSFQYRVILGGGIVIAAVLATLSLAQGPDITPPLNLLYRDVFIDSQGTVINDQLEPRPDLDMRPVFINSDGTVALDSLVEAPGLLTRPVFVGPDGSVLVDSLIVAPGLLFRPVFIDSDGSVTEQTLDPPPGLNTRPVFISDTGEPIEDPTVSAPERTPELGKLVVRGVWPNPFNPAAELSFRLRAPARVRVTIYDVRGRLVRTLHEGDLPADLHVMRWDGKDDRGVRVASGSYVVRIAADEETATLKVVLLE